MSPAGYWPQLHAAIEAGADAVYFGLHHFSARAKTGFSLDELPQALAALHRRGVKGYITFNTLAFDHELPAAGEALAAIARAGADAIIVQDVGLARLAARIAPGLTIHASTQMSVTNASGVRLAASLGAARVTLARELSLDQVRAIASATDCELEIFVHGALCVAYSGQCLSSEAWGGRSANRGQCAQACRLPYDLIVDGAPYPTGDARYPLSPGDLFGLHHVPQMVDIGVAALKIEGRYKGADYVALTTSAYRDAVDAAWAGRPSPVTRERELELEQVYSRGLGPFFLEGTNHQAVVRGRAPRHRGVRMGTVREVVEAGVIVEAEAPHNLAPLKPGDGVVFDAADWRSPEEPEEGGRIFEVLPRGACMELRFANRALDISRIRPGDWVWRTDDPSIARAARPFLEAVAPRRKQPVRVRVVARENERLDTEWSVEGARVRVQSTEALGSATRRALDLDLLRAQLGRLGNTAYEIEEIVLDAEGAPFAPASVLNQVRRRAVELLEAAQAAPRVIETHDPAEALADLLPAPVAPLAAPPTLDWLVRTSEQLEAAIAARPASITLDYLDLYGVRASLDRIRAAGIAPRVASPRVLKPGEEKIADFLLSCECPILVRPAALLHELHERSQVELAGDFSLNASNRLAAAEWFRRGASTLTPAHDLNAEQILEVARGVDPSRIEAVIWQHLPVFHTEHCIFCRFLSEGTSHLDCGRPCEKHVLALRDPAGRAHPVLADAGCRNTVFGAEAQQATSYLSAWIEAGISRFRIEFTHESRSEAAAIGRAFSGWLACPGDAPELARQLSRWSPGKITQGSLLVPEGYRSEPDLR